MKKETYARTKDNIVKMQKLEFWGKEDTAVKKSNKVEDLCDEFELTTDCKTYKFDNYADALKSFNNAVELGQKAFIIGLIDVDGMKLGVATSDSVGRLIV